MARDNEYIQGRVFPKNSKFGDGNIFINCTFNAPTTFGDGNIFVNCRFLAKRSGFAGLWGRRKRHTMGKGNIIKGGYMRNVTIKGPNFTQDATEINVRRSRDTRQKVPRYMQKFDYTGDYYIAMYGRKLTKIEDELCKDPCGPIERGKDLKVNPKCNTDAENGK